jgi:hypothetical protein
VDTNSLNAYAGNSGPALSFSTATLIASLIWGSIGFGFSIYGKKQRSAPALFGGIALMAISYFIASALWMSVTAVAIIAVIWYWSRYAD